MANLHKTPESVLKNKCIKTLGHDNIFCEDFAKAMDKEDPLASFREKFSFPKLKDLPCVDHSLVSDLNKPIIYMTGHSLGLKPKSADVFMKESLDAWGQLAVMSHWEGPLPAASCDLPGRKLTANLIGAKESEVVLMNGLTINLNLLLMAFYKPTPDRHIILMEDRTFSSDLYAAKGHAELHGYDPSTSVIKVKPREGEHTLRPEDILKTIEELGDRIAVILFGGVQCITGQKFDMEAITKAGHKKGCIVLFDLAHAIGNVKIELDKWGVDCACWCSYKYLNSGAGGMAGIYINNAHTQGTLPKQLGWWGNKASTRFQMREDMDLAEGVEGFRISNPPPWTACLNLASLKIFDETSMDALLDKQFLLTGFLETLILHYWSQGSKDSVQIITPLDPNQRGNQLSLIVPYEVLEVTSKLERVGIIVDERPPNIIRVTPAPLYVSFHDVYCFVEGLKKALLLCSTTH